MNASNLEHLLGQIEAISEEAAQGNSSALEAHVKLALLEKQIKASKKAIEDEALEEANQYSKGDEPTIMGFTVSAHSRKTAKVQYPNEIATMLDQVKEYEKLSKLGKPGLYYASPDGEEIAVIPAQFTHSNYIKLTAKK